jgi:hypothetical protein
MLRKSLIAGSALALLAVAPLAQADHDRYWSEPQVRLGVDVIWGGSYWGPSPGYRPAPRWVAPPPAWVYRPHYGPPGHWRPPGKGHWKHDHRRHQDDWRRHRH